MAAILNHMLNYHVKLNHYVSNLLSLFVDHATNKNKKQVQTTPRSKSAANVFMRLISLR
jgi:hypothetical protein